MRFKTKFKDYIPETEFLGVKRWDREVLLDKLWSRILSRYPKHPKHWEDIYEEAKTDMYRNYTYEVNVYIKNLEGEK